MRPDEQKARSRGVSRDMSPEAISKRFDILVELHELARALAGAKRVGKAELQPAPRSQGNHAES